MSALVKKENGAMQLQSVTWSSNNHNSIDPYDILAVEIIKQAVHDYREELRKSKSANKKTRECYQLERFFRSEYGQLLSMDKGEYIMEQIQKEVEAEANA